MKAEHYADIGQYLHDVREGHRVTIEQAAQALHIHAKYLHKLEKGDLTDMPAKVYVRGYVKNYAEYLRLNPDEVLASYEKLFDEEKQEFFIPENNLAQSMPSHGILWFCTAGLAALCSYWYFAMQDQRSAPVAFREIPSGPMPSDIPEEWKTCLSTDDTTCFRTLADHYLIPAETPLPELMDVGPIKAAAPAPTPTPVPPAAASSQPEATQQKIQQRTRHRHHAIPKPVGKTESEEKIEPEVQPAPDENTDTDTMPKPDDNPAPETETTDKPD